MPLSHQELFSEVEGDFNVLDSLRPESGKFS